MRRPNLYIIAGPNGAGKTTASFNLLPDVLHCPNFVNADEIARGLSPFAPELVSFQTGRIMLQRIEELLLSSFWRMKSKQSNVWHKSACL